MSDTAPRKFVKPAHAGARIPDPDHPGLDLPQGGAEVPWDHYWIARERQGDVIIEVPHGDVTGPAAQPAASAPSPAVSFMITKAQREQLGQRGFSVEQIANMTPEAAHVELEKPVANKAD